MSAAGDARVDVRFPALEARQQHGREPVAEVLLELTAYAAPCTNLLPCFRDGEFKRVSQKLHPGWSRLYARVLREGTVQVGDAVRVQRWRSK